MAVQKSKVTRSRRNKRRAHGAFPARELSSDKASGEVHRRHYVTPDGFYKGKKVLDISEE